MTTAATHSPILGIARLALCGLASALLLTAGALADTPPGAVPATPTAPTPATPPTTVPATAPATAPVTAPATAPAGVPVPPSAGVVPATKPATTQPDTWPAAAPTTRKVLRPGEKGVLLNFKDASLRAVLEYLSEVSGLVILEGATVEGRISVISRQPLTVDEAVALLDSALRAKGYAAIRTGRTLKIVLIEQAARENLPVFSGSDPESVPDSDKMVTQVIPIKYADAVKLKADLSPLIGSGATLTTNQASNSLVLIDTQTNIRRIMTIIQALDAHMASVAEVKVFQLKYADASSTASMITTLFKQDANQDNSSRTRFFPFGPGGFGRDRGRSSRGNSGSGGEGGREQRVIASSDSRTNAVVVSAPPDLMKVVESVIKQLDSNPSESEAVFVYPLKNADAANVQDVMNQVFWDSATSSTTGRTTTGSTRGGISSRFGGSSRSSTASSLAASAGDLIGNVYVVADEDTNSLLVRAATKHHERIKEILNELDRPIRQVLIKVLIAEVTHDKGLDLGAEFSVLNLHVGGGARGSIGTDFNVAAQTNGLISKVVSTDFTATIRALGTLGKLDVLSRPYILASDNQEATITVGEEVPFIRNTRTTETGQTLNTIEYEDIGIILKVTPHVNPEGVVVMDVAPEISTLTGTTVPISETVDAPVFAKRSATTRVAIQHGKTIVIGGLMQDRLTDTISKVPILGDLPHVGAAFRRTVQQKSKTELLIFLTPLVAKDYPEVKPVSDTEEKHVKVIQDAGGDGAYADQIRAMKRKPKIQPNAPLQVEPPTQHKAHPRPRPIPLPTPIPLPAPVSLPKERPDAPKS